MPKPSKTLSDRFIAQLRLFERSRQKMEKLLIQGHVSKYDVHLFYEGAFLRTITLFEGLFEELFIGLLSGGLTPVRTVHPKVQFRTAPLARGVVQSGRNYVDWFPFDQHTKKRAQAFFKDGLPYTGLSKDDLKEIERMLLIRHAVAHQSQSAKSNFENNVIGPLILLPNERTPSGFLRSQIGVSPPRTHYEDIAGTCAQLARKLCT